jgi:hypothetical protein
MGFLVKSRAGAMGLSILFIAMALIVPVSADEKENSSGDERFNLVINKSDRYSYDIFFDYTTTLSPEKMSEIIIEPQHVRMYLNKVVTIDKSEIVDSVQVIDFTVSVLFYSNRIVYERTIDKTRNMVTFRVTDFTQNIQLLPGVTGSAGWFEFKESKNGTDIHFYQYFKCDRTIRDTYLAISKKNTRIYFKNLVNYLESL